MSNVDSDTGVPEGAKEWKVPEEPKPEEQKSEEEIREQVRKEQIEEARQRAEGIQERAKGASPKILERVKIWADKLAGENADIVLRDLDDIEADFGEMVRDNESEAWKQYLDLQPGEIKELFKILYGRDLEPVQPMSREELEGFFQRKPMTEGGGKIEKRGEEDEERRRAKRWDAELERRRRVLEGKEQAPRPTEEDIRAEAADLEKLKKDNPEHYSHRTTDLEMIVFYGGMFDRENPGKLDRRAFNYPGWTVEDCGKLWKILGEKTGEERERERYEGYKREREYYGKEIHPPTKEDLGRKVSEFLDLKERDPREYQRRIEEMRYWILDGGRRQEGMIFYLEGGWQTEDAKKLLKLLKEKGPSLGNRIRKKLGLVIE